MSKSSTFSFATHLTSGECHIFSSSLHICVFQIAQICQDAKLKLQIQRKTIEKDAKMSNSNGFKFIYLKVKQAYCP